MHSLKGRHCIVNARSSKSSRPGFCVAASYKSSLPLFFPATIVILSGCLKSGFLSGWSKTSRCKAREIVRNEAYFTVRRNDEG